MEPLAPSPPSPGKGRIGSNGYATCDPRLRAHARRRYSQSRRTQRERFEIADARGKEKERWITFPGVKRASRLAKVGVKGKKTRYMENKEIQKYKRERERERKVERQHDTRREREYAKNSHNDPV